MKLKRICLVLMMALAILLVIAAVIIQAKFGILLPEPRIPHTTEASEQTALRMEIDPAKARDFIATHYLAGTSAPAGILDWVLPYETAVFCDPDLNTNSASVRVFLNTRRGAPIIQQATMRSGVLQGVMGITWDPPEMVVKRRGVLLLDGTMPILPESVSLVRQHWGVVTPLSPLTLRGGHLFELVLDLRDGRGFTLVTMLLDWHEPVNSPSHPTQVVYLLKKLASIRLWADFSSLTTLDVKLEAECRPELQNSDASSLAFLLNSMMGQSRARIQRNFGLNMEGTAHAEGLVISGDYTATGFEKLLGLPPAESTEKAQHAPSPPSPPLPDTETGNGAAKH